MYKYLLVLFAVTALAHCSLDKCLKTDSISCLQLQVYRTAKSIFDKSKMELIGGIAVSKSTGRRAKSLEEIETEEKIVLAEGVEQRQRALEDYFTSEVSHLWNEGSVTWNPLHATKTLIDFIPNNWKSELSSSFVGEGRGKEKKQFKMLLPLLVGIKLKMAAFAALAYMGIAVIAKKAVLAGLISLLVSGFIAIKHLIESHRKHEEVGPYHAAAWDPYAPGLHPGGMFEHDLTPSAAKQQLAYANQPHQP